MSCGKNEKKEPKIELFSIAWRPCTKKIGFWCCSHFRNMQDCHKQSLFIQSSIIKIILFLSCDRFFTYQKTDLLQHFVLLLIFFFDKKIKLWITFFILHLQKLHSDFSEHRKLLQTLSMTLFEKPSEANIQSGDQVSRTDDNTSQDISWRTLYSRVLHSKQSLLDFGQAKPLALVLYYIYLIFY